MCNCEVVRKCNQVIPRLFVPFAPPSSSKFKLHFAHMPPRKQPENKENTGDARTATKTSGTASTKRNAKPTEKAEDAQVLKDKAPAPGTKGDLELQLAELVRQNDALKG